MSQPTRSLGADVLTHNPRIVWRVITNIRAKLKSLLRNGNRCAAISATAAQLDNLAAGYSHERI